MPHDFNPDWGHVYDWLDLPALDEGEQQAKLWLEAFVKPAGEKDYQWLGSHMLICTYEGRAFRVSGASRLGDVWLNSDLSISHGHEYRVDVLKCSNWVLTEIASRP